MYQYRYVRQDIRYDGVLEYYRNPGYVHEQAYNWYGGVDASRYLDLKDSDKYDIMEGVQKYFKGEADKQSVSKNDFKTMEASGPLNSKCICGKTCQNDAMFGGKCDRDADQEDGLCTPCRGYKIFTAQTQTRQIHCHGCNWGMDLGHYSEARAAEDIWSPKRPGEGEPDLP